MRFISWNVNGVRAALKKGADEFFQTCDADVICLQETKAQQEQVDFELPGYDQFWNSAEKKGYSGTAIFTRANPINVQNDLGKDEHDREGRVITAEFPDFFLITVYTPNSKRGLLRLDYRQEWDRDFLGFVKELEKQKPVIFCGDLNVAHKEIDLANPKTNRRNAGFTDEERTGFDNIVEAGFVDTFREFVQDGGHYTWWSNFSNARARNVGWRIDYFCISESLRPNLKNANILPNIMGSDHCPVTLEID